MPQVAPSGRVRVLLTMDSGEYDDWKAHADALGMPTATLLRLVLSELSGSIGEVAAFFRMAREKNPEGPSMEELDDLAAKLLWRTLKELPSRD